MEQSPTIAELAKALCKAQTEMEAVKRTRENPFFKSMYADLADVLAAIKKPLTDNGLSIIQAPETVDGRIGVTTTLLHASGEWVRATLSITPKDLNNPQIIGSIITYFRRYAVSGFSGMASEADDDGESGKGEVKPDEKKEEKRAEAKGGPISKGQKDYMNVLFKKAGYESDLDKIAYVIGVVDHEVKAVEQLSSKEGHLVIESLKVLTAA